MSSKGKIKTRPFDSAEFLDTPEAIAAYLADALNSGNSAEFQDALNVVARARAMTEIDSLVGLKVQCASPKPERRRKAHDATRRRIPASKASGGL